MTPSISETAPPSAPDDAADRRARHSGRRLLRAFVSIDSYGLVLLLIIVTYAMSASMRQEWVSSAVLFLQIVTVWFALRTSRARRRVMIVATVVLAIAGAVGIVGVLTPAAEETSAAVFVVACLLYAIAPVSIARHIAFRPRVDRESMLGAVSAYLLIGMFFAFVYRALGALQSAPFFGPGGDGNVGQDLFFSFTTLTTTGYGNLIPGGQPGQSLAVAEMILGQLFLITALGKIVTTWRPRGWSAPPTEQSTAPQTAPPAATSRDRGDQGAE